MTLLGASSLESNFRGKETGALGGQVEKKKKKETNLAAYPCSRGGQPYTGLCLQIQGSGYSPVLAEVEYLCIG